uniref:Ig-like domain-containing protein n=1 Tax=Leptobrachium leishanense TaxID=445787 RepID=A0A8C5MMZ9_9ANUR
IAAVLTKLSAILCFIKGVYAGSSLVVEQPQVIRHEAGESVTFNCSFVMSGSSFSVSWSLGCENGMSMDNNPCYRNRVAFQNLNRQMVISNLTELDSETYCCRVEAPGGMKGKGNGTRLEVSPKQCNPGINPDHVHKKPVYKNQCRRHGQNLFTPVTGRLSLYIKQCFWLIYIML